MFGKRALLCLIIVCSNDPVKYTPRLCAFPGVNNRKAPLRMDEQEFSLFLPIMLMLPAVQSMESQPVIKKLPECANIPFDSIEWIVSANEKVNAHSTAAARNAVKTKLGRLCTIT